MLIGFKSCWQRAQIGVFTLAWLPFSAYGSTMNLEIVSENRNMGRAARGLCGLLFALAAILWTPAQATAAPCHGAMQAESSTNAQPAAGIARAELAVLSAKAVLTDSVLGAAANAVADCCNGGDCSGCGGCAVAALPMHAFVPRAMAPVAYYAVSTGRRPSLNLPELFRPPIPA